jgi:hypothetical protein
MLNKLKLRMVPLSFETKFSTPVRSTRENTFGNAKHVIVNASVKEEIPLNTVSALCDRYSFFRDRSLLRLP